MPYQVSVLFGQGHILASMLGSDVSSELKLVQLQPSALHAGLLEDVKVVQGRARLTALLPADWRDATVSDHVERHVYIQRPPDGSERAWDYLVRRARQDL